MDGVLFLVVGIALGILLMWLYISMRDYWKRNKDLRSSSAKARKEVQEKALKARLDAQNARTALFKAALRVFFLVMAIVVTTWLVWMIVMI
jgi:hypothetical protein